MAAVPLAFNKLERAQVLELQREARRLGVPTEGLSRFELAVHVACKQKPEIARTGCVWQGRRKAGCDSVFLMDLLVKSITNKKEPERYTNSGRPMDAHHFLFGRCHITLCPFDSIVCGTTATSSPTFVNGPFPPL